MPAPPVRVYLDQKLKFWMAFVGAVTLFYLSVLDSRLLFPPTAPAFVLLVVHPDHKSSNAQSLLQYADSAGYEVLALESNRDWARELSTAINSHPKKRNARVLLLVNQEVDFANLSQPAKLRQVGKGNEEKLDLVALGFTLPADAEFLASQCEGRTGDANDHPFLACQRAGMTNLYLKLGKLVVYNH